MHKSANALKKKGRGGGAFSSHLRELVLAFDGVRLMAR